MSLIFLFLFWVHFFFLWPEVVGGGKEDDTQECEKEIVKCVSTFIVLEIRFGHLENLVLMVSDQYWNNDGIAKL